MCIQVIIGLFVGSELGSPDVLARLLQDCYRGFGAAEVVPMTRVGGERADTVVMPHLHALCSLLCRAVKLQHKIRMDLLPDS